jgi:hypothetical protein
VFGGLVFWMVPSAALAGDTVCVFDALPYGVQQQAMRAAGDSPIDHLANIGAALDIKIDVLLAALGACGVPVSEFKRPHSSAVNGVGWGLPGYVVSHASEVELVRSGITTKAGLENAWAGLSPREHQAIKAAFPFRGPVAVTREIRETIFNASRKAGWVGENTDAPNSKLFMGYFMGRAIRENADATF